MIRPPKRSVTRFFIPLIDVLILLFCIFLLLPFARPEKHPVDDNEKLDIKSALEEVDRKTRLVEVEKEKLAQARSATGKDLTGRISPILLRIDSRDGKLYREVAGEKVLLNPEENPGQIRKMVEKDRKNLKESGFGRREPYYIFLPEPGSPFPTVAQRQKYLGWFAEVDAAADIGKPDLIPGGGGS